MQSLQHLVSKACVNQHWWESGRRQRDGCCAHSYLTSMWQFSNITSGFSFNDGNIYKNWTALSNKWMYPHMQMWDQVILAFWINFLFINPGQIPRSGNKHNCCPAIGTKGCKLLYYFFSLLISTFLHPIFFLWHKGVK